MKTKVEYEASDIHMEDPLHSTLGIGLLMSILTIQGTREKLKKEGMSDADASNRALSEAIAGLLTLIAASDYVISKREEVPAVFREG